MQQVVASQPRPRQAQVQPQPPRKPRQDMSRADVGKQANHYRHTVRSTLIGGGEGGGRGVTSIGRGGVRGIFIRSMH